MQKEPSVKETWFKRIFKFPNGDVIAANIGDHSEGNVVGKNIIQIGRLIFPMWLAILAGCACLVVIVTAVNYMPNLMRSIRINMPIIRCVFPYPMEESKFNIAILPLTLIDKTKGNADPIDITLIPAEITKQLQINLDNSNLHSSYYEIRPATQTCAPANITEDGRKAEVKQLGNRIHANVIIYGEITQNADNIELKPEFYVDYQGFGEASEIISESELGKPLVFYSSEIDLLSLQINDRHPLYVRSTALSLITLGLAAYSIEKYDSAIAFFSDAKSALPESSQKTVDLLIANSYTGKITQDNSTQYVKDAYKYYDAALSIDCNYARALTGMAGAFYLASLGNSSDISQIQLQITHSATGRQAGCKFDFSEEFQKLIQNKPDLLPEYQLLKLSERMLEVALQTRSLSSTVLPAKIAFLRGQLYLSESAFFDVDRIEESTNEFTKIINEFNTGNSDIRDIAGLSYIRLAHLVCYRRETLDFLDQAIEKFKVGMPLLSQYMQITRYAELGDIYLLNKQEVEAKQSYQRALGVANSIGYEKDVREIEEKLSAIDTNNLHEVRHLFCGGQNQ